MRVSVAVLVCMLVALACVSVASLSDGEVETAFAVRCGCGCAPTSFVADDVWLQAWQTKHSKSYKTQEETSLRLSVFRHNLELIAKHNSERHGWSMSANAFADLTQEEFKVWLPAPTAAMARIPPSPAAHSMFVYHRRCTLVGTPRVKMSTPHQRPPQLR